MIFNDGYDAILHVSLNYFQIYAETQLNCKYFKRKICLRGSILQDIDIIVTLKPIPLSK